MPKIVGVLTSQTGSVIKDIINVSTRRNPNVYIRLLPVPVQGEGAAAKIADAIKLMNDEKLADVIILARGGGSLEDLWPFNEEIVARAIFRSELPVISAVGHETDFSISDFVADLRAPTPSAAAELAVANVYDVKENLNKYNNRLAVALNKKLELSKLKYEKVLSLKVLKEPLLRIQDEYIKLDNNIKLLYDKTMEKYKEANNKFINLVSKLDSLGPLKTLTRGYSIVQKNNKIIKSVNELKKGDKVDIRLLDGNVSAIIDK